MSPPSIISKNNDSPSTSSSFTPHKRSFAETVKLPSALSNPFTIARHPTLEEYLLCELQKNLRQGVISVLEKLETENYDLVTDSRVEPAVGIPPSFAFHMNSNYSGYPRDERTQRARNFEASGCYGGGGADAGY